MLGFEDVCFFIIAHDLLHQWLEQTWEHGVGPVVMLVVSISFRQVLNCRQVKVYLGVGESIEAEVQFLNIRRQIRTRTSCEGKRAQSTQLDRHLTSRQS